MDRVFCVGLPRTGTTSMVQAGGILGYNTWHYGIPSDCDVITNQTIDYKVFLKNDFYADLPIPMYYKELDSIFPNSKFILTVRDIDGWLDSINYIVRYNLKSIERGRRQWKDKNFNLWEKFFGTCGYDKDIIEKKFHDHNNQVIKYFKNRDSLLVFNMEEAGWEPLCKFLDRDIPDVPFPHGNKRRKL